MDAEPYHADPSLKGKLRRRIVRLQHRRPAARGPERPMLSFSFDDAPQSAFTTGAEVLERHGVRGSYFICAGTAGRSGFVGRLGDRSEIARASAAGHEIACHTYSHLDCGKAAAAQVGEDLDHNASTLHSWGLPSLETFAYPYGDVGPAAKRLLADRFALSRALHHGVVEAGTDLAQAPAVGVEGPDGEAKALHWMEEARRRKAWLILFTHGVESELTPYGCTAGAFGRLVNRAVSAGFEVVTVAEGARRMRGAAP
jgi:peptidoglycan/xylan/chitin deacetylase (PgdA/CDA1 family)